MSIQIYARARIRFLLASLAKKLKFTLARFKCDSPSCKLHLIIGINFNLVEPKSQSMKHTLMAAKGSYTSLKDRQQLTQHDL